MRLWRHYARGLARTELRWDASGWHASRVRNGPLR